MNQVFSIDSTSPDASEGMTSLSSMLPSNKHSCSMPLLTNFGAGFVRFLLFETGSFVTSIGRRNQHDLTFPSLDKIGSSTRAIVHLSLAIFDLTSKLRLLFECFLVQQCSLFSSLMNQDIQTGNVKSNCVVIFFVHPILF